MANLLLTCLLLTNVVLLGVFLYFARKVSTIYTQIIDYLTPVDEKTPSALAQTISTISDMIARALVAQLKTTFMGVESGKARGEQAVELEIVAAQNPLLGIALNTIPGIKKYLKRNPGLIDFALKKLSGASIQQPVTTAPNNGHDNQVKFNL